jgi:hypothetical protein
MAQLQPFNVVTSEHEANLEVELVVAEKSQQVRQGSVA